MKKNKTAKVFAIFALLGIILSIVGTGILVLTSGGGYTTTNTETFNQERLQEILENNPDLKIHTGTVEEDTKEALTATGEIK